MTGVRLVWAMSRDERFPGWQVLHKVSPGSRTPLNATIVMTVISAVILGLFSTSTDALFKLFSAATLLPAIIYAITVGLYIAKRPSAAREQRVHPRTLGDADTRRGRGLAGLRAGPVPGRLVQRPLAVCAGDGRDRRRLPRLSARHAVACTVCGCPTCTRSTPNSTTRPSTTPPTATMCRDDRPRASIRAPPAPRPSSSTERRRSCRPGRGPGAPALPRRRWGRTGSRELLASVVDGRTERGLRRGRADRRGRPGQPGRNRAGLGPRHRATRCPRRSCGRTAAPRASAPSVAAAQGHLRRAHRAGPGPVLLRTQDGAGCAATSTTGRRGHHLRHLAAPPADRGVRHRRLDRQPVPARSTSTRATWDDELLALFGLADEHAPDDHAKRRGRRDDAAFGGACAVGRAGRRPAGRAARRAAACDPETAKCTFGTGAFLLANTGTTACPLQRRPGRLGRLAAPRPHDILRRRTGLHRRLRGALDANSWATSPRPPTWTRSPPPTPTASCACPRSPVSARPGGDPKRRPASPA